ncbi:unnamed protein product [Paramecium octaurelia]|uniref:4-hydroxyphenylpyruvate dioxygenase n=1 Tax=Paramecium octaurelia TaxID=43137 RepID=A0A8S1SM71_PAROT|nr:unnamed protein product [Paramecium octaurelia]
MADQLKQRPDGGKFLGFDHIHFWVGNAFQAASFYVTRFGFQYYAYRGLETGVRDVATHVLRNGEGVFFAFSSPYGPENVIMNTHQTQHGDGVRDVAFRVEDARALYDKAIAKGAKSIRPPTEDKDENGSVVLASIQTYGDTIHTFVQRNDYKGFFLPGFTKHPKVDPINSLLPPVDFLVVDHVVGNQPEHEMVPVAEWYEKTLDFHRFWSVDDSILHTDYSSLQSIVVADYDEVIKMPINEPAHGKKVSQIQEYVDYYTGSGVQHIALKTDNILKEVEAMRARGLDFLSIPDTYYDNLRKNIPHMNFKIAEDIDIIQKNKILVDYDDKGYLLQIFTKPLEDRPTLFIEIIQRRNHSGFGAGNFKSLFQSIELEQSIRGNLTDNPKYKAPY